MKRHEKNDVLRVVFRFQEIDLATGTLANIQSGSKKLLGKVNPIYALQVNDSLIYAAGPSFDGANVKVISIFVSLTICHKSSCK